MKITGQQPPKTPELTSGKAKDAERRTDARVSPSTDAPSLSRAKVPLTVQRVKDAILAAPDVRAERVAALKQRVEAGEYRVDSDRLAQNLLNSAIREDVERD